MNMILNVLFLILFLYTVSIPSIVTSSPSYSSSIGFEIHSYNDFRLWPGMFSKGASWVKIDVHYQPPSFCKSQKLALNPLWNGTQGCFVFSHNSPVPTRLYNTSFQLIPYLNSTQLKPFLPKTLTLALCFKISGFSPCDGSHQANDWITLASSFLQDLTAFSRTIPLNIILDGASVPNIEINKCLLNFAQPWNATWTNDNPFGALNSNNITLGYDRFQVMNVMESPINPTFELEILEKLGYGKFPHSSMPWLFWEPSNEHAISQVSSFYLSHTLHSQFLFAINIDPFQFSLYSGSYSGKAIHSPLAIFGHSPKVLNIDGSIHIIYSQPTDAPKNLTGYFYIVSQPPFSLSALPSFSKPIPLFIDHITWEETETLNLFPTIKSCTLSNQETGICLLWKNGTFCSIPASTSSAILTVPTVSTTQQFPHRSQSHIYCIKINFGSSMLGFTSIAPGIGATLALSGEEYWFVMFSTLTGSLISVYPFVPVRTDIHSADLVFVDQNDIFASLADSRGHINYVIFHPTQLHSTPLNIQDVGYNPVLSTYNSSILAVTDGGWCTNSEIHNKAAIPATCDHNPTPTDGVLTYSIGTLEQFISSTSNLLPACQSNGLISGMYSGGSTPSVTSIPLSDGSEAIISISIGIQYPSIGLTLCGAPIQTLSNQLVLDIWKT